MEERIRKLNQQRERPEGKYVLYWCQVNRRGADNHALAAAAEKANQLGLPLLCYEELSYDEPYASDRHHTFLLEAVPETAAALRALGAGYYFHLARQPAEPPSRISELAKEAAAVYTDDYPPSLLPSRSRKAPEDSPVAFYAVDSSCVIPMRRFEKREYAAYTFRPKVRRLLDEYLVPVRQPRLKRVWTAPLPDWHVEVNRRAIPALVSSCAIDHSVQPSLSFSGGAAAARARLREFLRRNLTRYARLRNEPSAHATSGLSPYLHAGHISALRTALEVREYARRRRLIDNEFLEELIVRRELAFNFAWHSEHPARLANLPDWARETLLRHAADYRPFAYERDQFERGATHDALWNAAQKELLLRGKIHGYYRMYWGKKIIEWSRTCEDAFETMVYLNDRYALDGRDPNTYTNILWCFGLHDKPWGERPVFGMVRTMSFEGMKRKTNVEAYLREIELLERTGQDPFRTPEQTPNGDTLEGL